MEDVDTVWLEQKNLTEDSDCILEQFNIDPVGKEDQVYGGRHVALPNDDSLLEIGKRKCSSYSDDEHEKEMTKLKNLVTKVLNSKKEELQKLYDEYKPENEKLRKCFSDKLNSQPIDGNGYTLEDPLKIEAWYFLTKEEARLHLQLDEYLESCSFIKPGSSPTAVIENLTANGNSKLEIFRSLPKDLIVSAVQRRINRLNKIVEHQRFVALLQYLIAQDYIKYGFNLDILSAHLESDNYKVEVDDNIRQQVLLLYVEVCMLSLNRTNAGHFEEIQWQFLHGECNGRLETIAKAWEVNAGDGLIYYSAYKELLEEHGMKYPKELKRMKCCDSPNETLGDTYQNLQRSCLMESTSKGMDLDCDGRKQEMIEYITVDVENQLNMMRDEIKKGTMQCSFDSSVLVSLDEFKERIQILDGCTKNIETAMEMGDDVEIQEELDSVEELQETGQEMDDSEWKHSRLSLELIKMELEIKMIVTEICRIWYHLQRNQRMEVEYDFDAWQSDRDAAKKAAYQHLKFEEFLDSCAFIKCGSSPTKIFEHLKKLGKISVPEELAFTCIKGKIHRLEVFDEHDRYVQFVKDLVDHVPHITFHDKISEIYDRSRLENKHLRLSDYRISEGLEFFHNLLCCLENTYHQRIREVDKDDLRFTIDWLCKRDRYLLVKSWRPTEDEDPIYDEVMKEKIEKKHSSKKYKYAKDMVLLHDRFNSYLTSCESVELSSIHEKLAEDKKLKEFASLPEELVQESIDFRIRMTRNMHEFERYVAFLKYLVWQRYKGQGGSDPQVLLKKVEDAQFSDLKAEYKEFADLPEHCIIKGILYYKDLCSFASERCLDPLKLADSSTFIDRINLSKIWDRKKFYEHPIYEEASW